MADAQPLRPITPDEWDAYEWYPLSRSGGPPAEYLRGLKKTEPPNDGYLYDRAPALPDDTEVRWVRRVTSHPS
jgi:hypothetical protein